MDNTSTLYDELKNNIITFVDEFGETVGTFDFLEKRPYFFGDITYDKEVRLINKSVKSKYNKMLYLDGNYYYGDFNTNQQHNIMGKFYKICVQHHIFGNKNEYILLIIDNPYYDSKSYEINKKGKYKLIIYSICHSGVYFKYLNNIGVYTSST